MGRLEQGVRLGYKKDMGKKVELLKKGKRKEAAQWGEVEKFEKRREG